MADMFSQGAGANFGPLGDMGARQPTGGYNPNNVGYTSYINGAPLGEINGNAGIRPYNPGISGSMPAPFVAPTFSNTMGGGAGFGGVSSAGAGPFGNTIQPRSWDMLAANVRSQQNPTMVAGGTNDLYSTVAGPARQTPTLPTWGDSASIASSLYGGANRTDPSGVLTGQNSTWPNPGTSLYPSGTSGWSQWGPSLTEGITGPESSGGTNPAAANNPYQMTRPAMTAVNSIPGGPRYQMDATGQPTNAADSAAASRAYLQSFGYSTPQQTAVAYTNPSNVNRNFNPSDPNSLPYNVNKGIGTNAPPSVYLWGNPASGTPGAMPSMINAAASANFQNANSGAVANSLYNSLGRGR